MDEALNEQAFDKGLVVRGRHYLVIGPFKNSTEGKTVILITRKLLMVYRAQAKHWQLKKETWHKENCSQLGPLCPQRTIILTKNTKANSSYRLV